MKVAQSLVAAAGLLGVTSAERRWEKRWDNGTVWTTEVVTAYTTYCPYATTVVQNNQTYTVTEATTLTITNCPCTISSIATPVIASTTLLVPTAPTVPPVGPSIASTSGAPPAGKTTSAPKSTTTPIQAAGAGMVGSSLAAVVLAGALAILL